MNKYYFRPGFLLLLSIIIFFTNCASTSSTGSWSPMLPLPASPDLIYDARVGDFIVDPNSSKPSKYCVVTGRISGITINSNELRRILNIENEVWWLSQNSINVTATHEASFNNLVNVLITFGIDRRTAENEVRNLNWGFNYRWLTNSNGYVTEWVCYYY